MISFKVPAMTQEEKWHEIEAAPGVTFRVLVRPPTLADSLGSLGAVSRAQAGQEFGAQTEYRIRASVANWRDVADEAGEPIPFSFVALASLLKAYRSAMTQLVNVVHEAWTQTDDAEKN